KHEDSGWARRPSTKKIPLLAKSARNGAPSGLAIVRCAPPSITVSVLSRELGQLPRLLVQHRNLLVARVQITSYNLHRSAPFLRALIRLSAPSLLARKEPKRLSNQPPQSLCPALQSAGSACANHIL